MRTVCPRCFEPADVMEPEFVRWAPCARHVEEYEREILDAAIKADAEAPHWGEEQR